LASFVPTPKVVASTPYRDAEQIWSNEQRRAALAEDKLKHPEPSVTKRAEPELIDTKPTTIYITEAERRELELGTKNRRTLNPQAFIRR
jgi:hypothetical protein